MKATQRKEGAGEVGMAGSKRDGRLRLWGSEARKARADLPF